mmetsp:Transcript_51468/g.75327  ORF Transcript_51468/g.75327 Transcript_51468/m.75327 type:complete len:231 (+) Transcript_51468:664-1356(+)
MSTWSKSVTSPSAPSSSSSSVASWHGVCWFSSCMVRFISLVASKACSREGPRMPRMTSTASTALATTSFSYSPSMSSTSCSKQASPRVCDCGDSGSGRPLVHFSPLPEGKALSQQATSCGSVRAASSRTIPFQYPQHEVMASVAPSRCGAKPAPVNCAMAPSAVRQALRFSSSPVRTLIWYFLLSSSSESSLSAAKLARPPSPPSTSTFSMSLPSASLSTPQRWGTRSAR